MRSLARGPGDPSIPGCTRRFLQHALDGPRIRWIAGFQRVFGPPRNVARDRVVLSIAVIAIDGGVVLDR
ncbi:hypothetical protein CGZ98_13020 [Enemella evansiae]|nr:hypothetical protein CGZ98_13020 [Enemella evansiae]